MSAATHDRIRHLIERAGHTLRDASVATGIPDRTLARYLSGTRDPSVRAVVAIADAYRVTTDWILRGPRR